MFFINIKLRRDYRNTLVAADHKGSCQNLRHHRIFRHHRHHFLILHECSRMRVHDMARIGLGIACVPDYMLKENDQLTPLMLKEPLPGRQLILAQHDSLTVSQAAERFIEMFTSI